MAYTNLLNQVRVGVRPGIVLPTFTPLLDLYPGATASYSFRKLRSSYSGSAIRVRRSTDGLETDISFNTQGELDETTLLSFVGNMNFVSYSSQYDNASWTKSGISITPNVATAPDGTLTADLFAETTQVTIHNIQKSGSISLANNTSWNSSIYIKKADGNTVSNNNIILGRDFANLGGGYWGGDKAIFNLDTGNVIIRDVSILGLEGATMSSVGNGWFRLQMWGKTTATYTSGYIPVLLNRAYYDANGNLSNPTQTYIAGQTGAQYYIWGSQFTYKTGDVTGKVVQDYTDVSGGYGGDAWVTKWYDQSGNSKHLTQVTAVNQPPLVVGRVINKLGGKPCLPIRTNGIYLHQMSYTGTMSSAGAVTLFSVAKFDRIDVTRPALRLGPSDYATSGSLHILAASTLVGTATFVQNQSNSYVYGATNTANTNRNLFYSLANGGLSVVGHNGANTGSNFSGSITSLGNLNGLYINTRFGYFGVDYYYTGDIQEIVLYNSEKSVATRADIENNINSFYSIYTPISSDSDAMAFISMAGLTNSTHQSAITTLVTSLKSSISVGSTQSLWSKMKAIYPFVGGTAYTHQFNLKDPRNINAAYRLVFNGGMTHTSSGAVPNGSNAYAATSITPSTALTSSQHISFYSMTNRGTSITNTSGEIEIGAVNSGTGIPGVSMGFNSTSWNSGTPNYFLARLSGGGYGSFGLTPIADTRGFGILSRTDINTVKAFWNGSYYGQTSQSYIAVPTPLSIFGRAYNIAGAETNTLSRKTCGFASIGDGLTDAESTELYNIVQTYQTTLGRQV